MVRLLLHASAWALLSLVTLPAGAQAVRSGRPDPLDAAADVPRTPHESAFKAYRRLGDTQPTPWKQANETVERIGGWRAYAREADPARAPADAASAPAPSPAPAPRGKSADAAPGPNGHKH
jgi:hypothetical protein